MNQLLIFITFIVLIAPVAKASKLGETCKVATAENYAAKIGQQKWPPYSLSLAPTIELRRQGLEAVLQDPELKKLSETSEHSVTYSQEEVTKFKNFFSSWRGYYEQENGKFAELAPYACGIFGADECQKVVRDATYMTAPYSGGPGYISLPDVVTEMGTEPIYAKASAKLALRTLGLVAIADQGKKINADLLEDTKQAFLEAGVDSSRVEEYAFKLLGIYGSRGASMSPLLDKQNVINEDNYIVFASLAVVASSISYLDTVMFPTGHTYSLPKNISTHCDYTRPYHFWLPAYLAYAMKKKGYSNQAIMQGLHILGTGYEEVVSVSNDHISTKDSALDSQPFYIIETQKNLAFDDVGIFWSLLYMNNDRRQIQADDFLERIMKKASPQDQTFLASSILESGALKMVSEKAGVDLEKAFHWQKRIGSEANLEELNRTFKNN
jgi:hypothetical protein